MKRVGRRVTSKLKKQVLSELSAPGSLISGIAIRYGISTSTLYKWRKKHALEVQGEMKSADEGKEVASKFIELSLQEEVGRVKLTKAELVFDSFSLLIEGDFSSDKLLKIVSAMES